MFVVYKGSDKVLLSDYNGKRYAFYSGIPKDIPEAVYKSMILSGHITSQDLIYCENPIVKEEVVEKEEVVNVEPKEPVKIKRKGRPKKEK